MDISSFATGLPLTEVYDIVTKIVGHGTYYSGKPCYHQSLVFNAGLMFIPALFLDASLNLYVSEGVSVRPSICPSVGL